jgi:pimeloyl-ACP methyl ester carboxylesterase
MVAVAMPLPYHGVRRPPAAGDEDWISSADLDRMVRAFAQTVVDIRCLLDWLHARPGVDPGHLGLVGMSLGGMTGLLAAQVEPRLGAAVAIVASGDPATVLERSPWAFSIRRELSRRGVSDEAMRRALAPIDPITYAGRNPGLKLLMMNGRYDLITPREAVRNTWRGLGKPQLVWLDSAHLSSFMYQDETFGAVASYLSAQFGLAPTKALHPRSAAGNVGVIMGADSGLMAAVMIDAWRLTERAPIYLSAGLTSRGPLAGVSLRLGDFASLGYGIRPFAAEPRPEPYAMLHVSF